jgi:hypothetical protein
VDIVERRRKCVEVVGKTGIVEDDVNKVITNVALLIRVCHVVVAVRRHHGWDVEYEFHAAVTPAVCEFSISIVARVQTSCIELRVFQSAESAEITDESSVSG